MTTRRERVGGLPPVLVPFAVLAVLFLVLPVVGLVVRAPWGSIGTELSQPESLEALRLSMVCASLATLLCLVLGVPLAWVLARGDLPGRSLLRALVTVPLVLPPVVGGIALFTALGRRGIVGRWLDEWFVISLPFTSAAVVVAEAFVALPFLVIAVEGSLRAADQRLEEAAATLGAGRWYVLRRVTLPMVAPGLAAGDRQRQVEREAVAAHHELGLEHGAVVRRGGGGRRAGRHRDVPSQRSRRPARTTRDTTRRTSERAIAADGSRCSAR